MLPLLPGFNPADSSSTKPSGWPLSSWSQGQADYTAQPAMFASMFQQMVADGSVYKLVDGLSKGNAGTNTPAGASALGFIEDGLAAEQAGIQTDWLMNFANMGSLARLSREAAEEFDALAQARQNLPPLSEISPLAQAVFDNLALSKPVSYATATLQVSVDVLSSDSILSSDPSWSFGLAALGLTSQNPSSSLEFDLPWALVAVGLQSAVQDVSSPIRQDGLVAPVANLAADVLKPDNERMLNDSSVQVALVSLPKYGLTDQDIAAIDRELQLPVKWVLAGLLQQQESTGINDSARVNSIVNSPLNSLNSLEMTPLEASQSVRVVRDELAVNQSVRQAELGLSELALKLTSLGSFSNSNAVTSLSNMANVSSFAMSEGLNSEGQGRPLNQLMPNFQMASVLPLSVSSVPVAPAPVVFPTDLSLTTSSNGGQVLVDSSVAGSVSQMVMPVVPSAGLPLLPFTNAQRMAANFDGNMSKLATSSLSDATAQLRPIEAIMAHNNQLISQALNQELSETLDEAKTRLQDDSALGFNSFFLSANGVSTGAMEKPVMTLPAINYALRQAQWETALGQRLMYVINQQVSQAQIQLNPAHLGPIRLMINFDRDQTVQVQMLAQHSQTKDAMEQALPRLREMLNEAGIKFDQLQVLQDSADNPHQGMKQSVMVRANELTQEEDTAVATEPARSPIAGPHTIDFYV